MTSAFDLGVQAAAAEQEAHRMMVLKHVEHRIKGRDELERLLAHLGETTSRVDGVALQGLYFIKGKDEFVLVMACDGEDPYLRWREICPPPPGASDWHEVLLTADEHFADGDGPEVAP
jgi:hypothetical protein